MSPQYVNTFVAAAVVHSQTGTMEMRESVLRQLCRCECDKQMLGDARATLLMSCCPAAGTAQVLNIIAAQQQQEALHSSQLLAALAAMDSDSPRHIRAMVEALAATYSEEGYFHREQQQQQQGSQMQQQAKAAVTAAVLRDRQRSRSASPDGPACYAEELRVSLSTSNNSMSLSASAASSPRRVGALRAAGLQQLGSPTTPCTPEFASPEMSFRTSYASSSQPLHAGAAAARMSTCSTASHSSAALPPPAAAAGLARLDGSSSGSSGRGSYGSGFTAAGGSCGYGSSSLASNSPTARHSGASGSSSTSSKNKYYPEVPEPVVQQREKPRRAGRKQWSVAHAATGGAASDNGQAAAAAAGEDTWHSCEFSSAEGRAALAVADSGAGAHDKLRPAAVAAQGARRKSRFNRQASPDSTDAHVRRSVKSFPLANLELER